MVLPSTYEVSGELSLNTMEMVAYGGFSDAYRGTLGGAGVCIKRLRIFITSDRVMVKKVPHPHNIRLDFHSLTSIGGTL